MLFDFLCDTSPPMTHSQLVPPSSSFISPFFFVRKFAFLLSLFFLFASMCPLYHLVSSPPNTTPAENLFLPDKMEELAVQN